MLATIAGTGDGTAPVVNITFPYIDQTHVKASVNGVPVAVTWTGVSQITFPSAVPAGIPWRVYRETPTTPAIVDFTDGSVLTEHDLDLAQTSDRYRDEELLDLVSNAIQNPIGDRASKFLAFDTNGNPIASSGTGTDAGLRQDLATSGPALIGYLTGANYRTLDKRLQDEVSVKDFGAKGDGVTDDTAAVQAAINAVELSGAALFFPAGVYMTGALTITKPIKLYGAGSNGWSVGLGSVLRRIAGTNAHHVTVAADPSFLATANYRFPALEILDLAFHGQWGYNTSGGGIHFADGATSWTSENYGYSLVMERCQVMEYNEAPLYLGSNRNAARVSSSIFRWSYTNVVEIGTASGDHRFHRCDFAGSQIGYSNVRGVSGAFGCSFIDCNNYSAAEHGYDWEDNSAVLTIEGGQINGNTKCGVVLRGVNGVESYPATIKDVMFEGNSLAGDGLYSDILLIDRKNVRASNTHYASGNRAKHLIEVNGDGKADGRGTTWKPGAFMAGLSNDPFSAGCEIENQVNSLAAIPAGATRYLGPQGEVATNTQTPWSSSRKRTIMGYVISLTQTPGTGESYTFTLFKNGVSTGLSGSISGSNNTLVVYGNVTLNQYDNYQLQVVTSAGATPAFVNGSILVKDGI